jgi:TctA family transporter
MLRIPFSVLSPLLMGRGGLGILTSHPLAIVFLSIAMLVLLSPLRRVALRLTRRRSAAA